MDKTCQNCAHLYVLHTGSQIILICRKTGRWKNYEDPCDCGGFKKKL